MLWSARNKGEGKGKAATQKVCKHLSEKRENNMHLATYINMLLWHGSAVIGFRGADQGVVWGSLWNETENSGKTGFNRCFTKIPERLMGLKEHVEQTGSVIS